MESIVYFDTDSYIVNENSTSILNSILNILNQNDLLKLEIIGHTDNTGSEKYNLELSKNRAESVYNFFKANKISENKVKTSYYGESLPIIDNSSKKNKAINRRVLIRILL